MNKLTWDGLKKTLKAGEIVSGKIFRHEPYGVLADIGYEYHGLIQINDFKDDGVMKPELYLPIGSEIKAKILGFKDSGCQVWLGVKPSQLESEN